VINLVQKYCVAVETQCIASLHVLDLGCGKGAVSILFRKELLKKFGQAGMELIDETVNQYSDYFDSAKEKENIEIRCNELKAKYPEKSSLFETYMKNQAKEYDALENEIDGSIMVLKIKR
jgi:tRNA1(Val) A37 N6-methylase TrmN6